MIATDLLVPADRAEASAVIASEVDHFWLLGAGTSRNLPTAATGATSISTRLLDRVVEYEPADLTVTVEAGCQLALLQETLAGGGQFLPCDYPGGGTVGGLIATGAVGPGALGYGAVRDRLLGITVITSDGAITRSGSRVVKSVAGFDLPKLYCGSFGTLGLIVEATFKVTPLPAVSELLAFTGARDDLTTLAAQLLGSKLRPTSLVATAQPLAESGNAAPLRGSIAIGVDGGPARVRRMTDEIRALAARLGLEVDGQETGSRTMALQPTDYCAALHLEPAAAREVFVKQATHGMTADLGTGQVFLQAGATAPELELSSLESWLGSGNALTIRGDEEVVLRRRLDPAAADLIRRLKRELDPNDRFNRGLLEKLL